MLSPINFCVFKSFHFKLIAIYNNHKCRFASVGQRVPDYATPLGLFICVSLFESLNTVRDDSIRRMSCPDFHFLQIVTSHKMTTSSADDTLSAASPYIRSSYIIAICNSGQESRVRSHPGQTSPAYIERDIRPILSLLLKIHLQSLIPGDKRPQLGLGNTFLLSLPNNVKATQKSLFKRLIASFFLFN